MRLLLDTHALLWWLADDPTLSEGAISAVAEARNSVYVSAVSAWEIAIKRSLGKLRAPEDLENQLRAHHFTPLPIQFSHALAVGKLSHHHRDPFDRLLIAQALAEGLTIVTRDTHVPRYGVDVIVA